MTLDVARGGLAPPVGGWVGGEERCRREGTGGRAGEGGRHEAEEGEGGGVHTAAGKLSLALHARIANGRWQPAGQRMLCRLGLASA